MKKWLTPIIALVAVAVLVAIFAIGNKSSDSAPPEVGKRPTSGLVETQGPWAAETEHLSDRLASLKLPTTGTEKFHQHALLEVVANGTVMPVPAQIGFAPGVQPSALHTHDTSGAIHMESDAPYPFTLGNFFDVWGVKLTKDQLGGFKNSTDATVQVFVNGNKVEDFIDYQLKDKDKIVVGYGKAGEVPAVNNNDFPKDL